MDKTLISLCAFMFEDGIQTYFQCILYEGCTNHGRFVPADAWHRKLLTPVLRRKCKTRSHNVLSSNDVVTVLFSSIVTLVGSIFKLSTIVSNLREKSEHSPGPFCRFWCNCFTKDRIIIILMFIGTLSNGVMNVTRTVNIYFIYKEHETSLTEMYLIIVHCMWLTFLPYSAALVVYFTFDLTRDKVFRILNFIGILLCSNYLATLCLNIDMVNDASVIMSYMDIILFMIPMIVIGLFFFGLAFIYKCICIDKCVCNNEE